MNREPITAGMVALALMVLLGVTLQALFRIEVPSANHDVLLVVIGVLTACVKDVVGYYFGSSSNSRQQQSTIAALASTAQTNATPDTLTLSPGDKATSRTTEAGTVIHKEDTP